ncbi:hypothetical protein UlMin_020974 [Ulmus minor]
MSRAGFSQLLVKKTTKGKETVGRNPGACNGFGGVVVVQNDGKLCGNFDQTSSHGVLSSSPQSSSNGISLREWLKPGFRKVDKVESFLVFREIMQLVNFAHSQGSALQELRPSCFNILPSSKVQYTGSLAARESKNGVYQEVYKKRPLEQNAFANNIVIAKQQKLSEAVKSLRDQAKMGKQVEFYSAGPQNSGYQDSWIAKQEHSITATIELEKKWYTSPEELNRNYCTFPSNIYGLGVLLFELLCCSESWEVHSAVMMDMRNRILPRNFLSENPKEAGFCLWLLHPYPSSRPSVRDIMQSELICGPKDMNSMDTLEAESETLLNFLGSVKDEKQRRASKLVEEIGCLEEDIKEAYKRYSLRPASVVSLEQKEFSPSSESNENDVRLMRDISQLEDAYFFMRSQIKQKGTAAALNSSKESLRNQDKHSHSHNGKGSPSTNQISNDRLGLFFDGLCKFARFSKFKVCSTLRNGDLFNSTNAICSLSFDRDEEYIAAARVSKSIKIFEFNALSDDTADVHYPVVEISNKSKLSCVSWNNYIKNYLASTDYDGVVQIWDAGTGVGLSQYTEHKKRAWSVDFSRSHPTKFASGSDDCTIKLWSINDKSSIGTIWSPANVCCVQFSDYSSHLLVCGSADYNIYGYDLRQAKIPLCTLAGHGKAVSFVKFLDAETLVSASTDNTLKLWDLNKTISNGLSSTDSSSLSFTGHTNEKNFVGLSVFGGYIVCGSETNEVYSYYKSLPMPITSHKFATIDPVSGNEIEDDGNHFVSSVCWRRKSNVLVAANSCGILKLLQMV